VARSLVVVGLDWLFFSHPLMLDELFVFFVGKIEEAEILYSPIFKDKRILKSIVTIHLLV
jgi:hypothetical protein